MELIVFIQVFNIVVIAIGTLFYMCCRSLTFSSSSSSSSSAADSVVADSAIVDSVVADLAADSAAAAYATDSAGAAYATDSAGADYATDSAVADSVGADYATDSSVADSVGADSIVDSAVVDYATDSVIVDNATDSAVADSVGADSVADSIVTDSAGADSAAADSVGADSVVADADIPPSLKKKYDVFISFRGADTRNIFTCHLHEALVQKKIETYIDNRLERGEEIEPALMEAIEKSKFWVIIFSKNYATSAWCLDELVRIIECNKKREDHKKKGQFVIPIFYHTDVSNVRHQRGSYEDAFAQHQSSDTVDKVPKWKEALTNAANKAGFHHPENTRRDADLVKDVVKDIWAKLCCESSCDLKGLVGIKSRIEQIELLLGIDSPDDCITVGIWGMGGIGKTTLAETVFHRVSSKFGGSCFLRNVTQRAQKDGLDHLEKTLLKEILKEEDLSIGSTMVRERLSKTKVLIVLDDVSDSKQIERLAGNNLQFDAGSRIIITSRDKSTLRHTVEEEQIYEVKRLKPNHALQLFCSRAFKKNSLPNIDYKGLVKKAVDYAGRVPSALIHLGSFFSDRKSKQDWEDAFNKWKKYPCEGIQKELGISYNGLEGNEKEIFLDIACFHKGWVVDKVERALDIRGFFGRTGIRILIDMSLISIDSKWKWEPIEMQTIEVQTIEVQTIEMHDSLQEMGRTIVQKQCIDSPCKRSRLFTNEDVYDVLDDNNVTRDVKAIFVNWSKIQKIQELPLERADFKVMSKLLMLIGNSFQTYDLKFTAFLDLPNSLHYFYWWGYPLESLPSNFSPEKLVELHMPFSKAEKLWTEDQRLVNLKVIDLCFSPNLTQVPNLSSSTKIVDINLHGCVSLVKITWSFQHLDLLTRLDLGCCTSLEDLPALPANIEYLNLQGGIQL